MPRKKIKTHTAHRYQKRFFPSGKVFWSCTLENCSHYRHDFDVIGKSAICWYCGNTFTVTRQQISSGQVKLHCSDCFSPRGFGKKKYDEQLKARIEKNQGVLEGVIEDLFETINEEINQEQDKKNNIQIGE